VGCNRSTQQRISGRVAFDRLEELKNQTRKIHSSAISGLGFWDVEIDKDIEMDSDLIEKLQNIANVSDEHDFPENLDRFF
jgi:hypothetical protein